jgi:hypothetical protein
MIKSSITKLKNFIEESVLFPSYSVRRKLSFRYVRGYGLEIGALQNPLEVLPGVTVRYVDYASREDNINKFPTIDASRIVITDVIDDGCVLAGIPTASQDFSIANHVLEHSANPLQTVLNWIRVIKKSGIIFITVPNGDNSFDYGREITTIEHIMDDYDLVRSGDTDTFTNRNREHYKEFVEISIPNLHKVQRSLKTYETESARAAYIDKLSQASSNDAHFHVFTKASLADFFHYVTVNHARDMSLREITPSRSGTEFVVILEKDE